jgi:Arc/MetJ-type ribon-helix-helix transcriptional regulator
MPVLTVVLPVETAARLERLAARRRVSKSEVVRSALDQALRRAGDSPSLFEAMLQHLGAIDSGVPDLGRNPNRLAGFGR